MCLVKLVILLLGRLPNVIGKCRCSVKVSQATESKVVLLREVFNMLKGPIPEGPLEGEILISLAPLSEYLTEEIFPDQFQQGRQHGKSHASRVPEGTVVILCGSTY